MFENFPYSNFHDLNVDWIITTIKQLLADWESYNGTWEDWKNDITERFDDLNSYVMNYFANLDVQDEINNKLEQMFTDGRLDELLNLFVPYVTPEMFGAVGDGLTDDTEAWNKAIETGKVIIANKLYLITDTLELDNDVYMNGIIYNDVSDGVMISGKSGKYYKLNVQSKRQYDYPDLYTGVKIINSNKCIFDIKTRNFYYGIQMIGDGSGTAYNTVNSAYLINARFFIDLDTLNNGWVNENYLYNIRCLGESGTLWKTNDCGLRINTSESRLVNSNHVLNACFEEANTAIELHKCRECTFTNIRTESCTYAYVADSDSYRNKIIVSYGTINKLDDGNRNVLMYASKNDNLTNTLIDANMMKNTYSNDTRGGIPHLYKVTNTGNVSKYIYGARSVEMGIQSNNSNAMLGILVNVSSNKQLKIIANGENLAFREVIVPFKNGEYVNDAIIYRDNSRLSQTTDSVNGTKYIAGADTSASSTITIASDVDTCFIGLVLRSGTLSNFKIIGDDTNYVLQNNPDPVITSIPTSNGYYIGQIAYGSDNNWIWNGTQWNVQTI